MWKHDEQSVDKLKKALSFLEDKHGFSLRFEEPRSYYYETADCEVLALFEIHKVYVAIGPIGETKAKLLRSGTRGGRIDIKLVCQCIDRNYTFESIPWDAKVDIEKELEEYARLLKRYCYKMLQGDFSQWSMINECIRKKRN
jgi:hypothetical protein